MFKVSEILIHDYVKEKKNKIGNFQVKKNKNFIKIL